LVTALLVVGCENKAIDPSTHSGPVTPPEPITPPEPVTPPDPATPSEPIAPPFAGTVWISPRIIDSADPSSVQSIVYAGREEREFYKGYVTGFIMTETYLFNVEYPTGKIVEFQVETEWGSQEAALGQVELHATELGRMPLLLIRGVVEMEIGEIGRIAANRLGQIHIDVDIAKDWIGRGFWQESLFHETVHTTLDIAVVGDHAWTAAQEADGVFISDYAQSLPEIEDLAETFLLWFAVRYRPERLSGDVRQTVLNTIPNRIAYLDERKYDLAPYILSNE